MTTKTRPTSDFPEFIGHWPRLTGRQEPEFESRHPGDEEEGDRAAKFGANVGLRCMPWQWSTLRGILSLQPENEYGERLWTHRDAVIECTRQQGKTLLIVLLILFHLFVDPAPGRARTRKIIYTAQRWSTASDVFDRVCTVIYRVPRLRAQLARKPSRRDNHGVIEVVLARDRAGKPTATAVAEFAPRTQDFGRGLTELDVVILDEAYDVIASHLKNLRGAQSAAPNPQTVSVSTSPVFGEHPNCHYLADLHRQGHRRVADLFYRLFAAPREMSRDDPKAWRSAQPSFDIATDEREIRTTYEMDKLSAQRRALFDADYLGWGVYPPPEADANSVIPAQDWDDMGPRNGRPSLINSPAVGLHRSESGIWVITGAWYTDTGRAHLEVGYSKATTSGAAVTAIVDLVAAWDPVAVAIKRRGDAAALEDELIKAGTEPEMVDGGRWSQWCGGFLNAACSAKLSHRDQAELNDAAAAAVKHELPAGGFTWDEDAAGASAAALCSATLAHGALLAFGNERKAKPAAPVSDASAHNGRSSEFDAMSAAF